MSTLSLIRVFPLRPALKRQCVSTDSKSIHVVCQCVYVEPVRYV